MKKYFEIVFLRAVACLLVVVVHVTSISGKNGYEDYFSIGLNQFSRIGTPIFAAISAFLLYNSVKRNGFDLVPFLKSRATKVLFPYLIWTLLYSCVSWLSGYHFTLKGFISFFLFGSGYYHLYFMAMILQFYLIFPFMQMIKNRKTLLILYLISLPINYFSVQLIDHQFSSNVNLITTLITSRSFFLNWISYFLLGALLVSYFDEILIFIKRKMISFVISALFVLVLAGIFYETYIVSAITTSSNPANLLYIPIFILFLLAIYSSVIKWNLVTKLINIVGGYSMGIYLIHPLVLLILQKVLPDTFWSPYLVLVTFALTCVLSILLTKAILYLPLSKYIVPVAVLNKESVKASLPITNKVHMNIKTEIKV